MNRPHVVVPMTIIGVAVLLGLGFVWMIDLLDKVTEPDHWLTCPTNKLESCLKNFHENSNGYKIQRLVKQDDTVTMYVVVRE